ncbi:MAG: hypothetical protein IPK85_07355 [Gemmatimonadetes bacterium]|nr:hypothetical protein [Gemmatimonadota bacterium]
MVQPPPAKTPSAVPPLPRLTFRVAIAGTRELTDAGSAHLVGGWDTIASTIVAELRRIHASRTGAHIARFYHPDLPVLRVTTGLAEGADSRIARAAVELRAQLRDVHVEVGAVLPTDAATYRDSREAAHRPVFDALVSECAYVIALDGQMARPEPDTSFAKVRRGRAYRAQGALLLRHADLLVAAADSTQPGRTGGSMETVRAALERDLPVVFIDTARGGAWFIQPFHNLAAALAADPPGREALVEAITAHLHDVLIDPDSGATAHAHDEGLLEEYFGATGHAATHATIPPVNPAGERRPTRRERLWRWFERRFQGDHHPLATDVPLEPVQPWRARATSLNYHYAGLYRGAYLLNYTLAILAVTLAALSLVLLGQQHTPQVAAITGEEAALPPGSPLLPVLLALAVLKGLIVVTIARNTHQATHGSWNDKMVDYRYLAERLRAMYYLPLLGSFEPPSAAPPQYASRVVRQSAVDWLFEAIVRSIPPAAFTHTVTIPGTAGASVTLHLLQPDARSGLARLQAQWIVAQAEYHRRLARTMDRLHQFLDTWGRRLNIAVIAFVAIDIALTIGELAHLLPAPVAEFVSANLAWLVFLAAVLPAVVAGLNAVRFQSECRRLADRSAVIRTILRGPVGVASGGRLLAAEQLNERMTFATAHPDSDPGSWVAEVLRQTETVARDMAEEVGEWSVLYAKELPEP